MLPITIWLIISRYWRRHTDSRLLSLHHELAISLVRSLLPFMHLKLQIFFPKLLQCFQIHIIGTSFIVGRTVKPSQVAICCVLSRKQIAHLIIIAHVIGIGLFTHQFSDHIFNNFLVKLVDANFMQTKTTMHAAEWLLMYLVIWWHVASVVLIFDIMNILLLGWKVHVVALWRRLLVIVIWQISSGWREMPLDRWHIVRIWLKHLWMHLITTWRTRLRRVHQSPTILHSGP